MNKVYAHLVVAVLGAASLSSCGKANYAFKANTSPYHSSATRAVTVVTPEQAPVAAPDEATLTASTEATPVPVATPARAAAKTLGTPKAMSAAPVTKAASLEEKTAAPATAPTKAERKAVRQMIKQAIKETPASPQAEGKSQVVAAVLALLLGFFGVHRFYLGYTGMGILYIGLLLLSFVTLGITGFILAILVLIDIIRILLSSLKPKNGSYTK